MYLKVREFNLLSKRHVCCLSTISNQPTNQLHEGCVHETLTVAQPLKHFPAFYGIRSFITVFTRALTGPFHDPDVSSLHTPCRIF
jgi:hypothetical protein